MNIVEEEKKSSLWKLISEFQKKNNKQASLLLYQTKNEKKLYDRAEGLERTAKMKKVWLTNIPKILSWGIHSQVVVCCSCRKYFGRECIVQKIHLSEVQPLKQLICN